MRIHRDGWGTIACIWAVCIALIVVIALFVHIKWVEIPLIVLIASVMVFILYFFRVPVRRGDAQSPRSVTSVADGEVVIIEKVYEPEYIKGECIQVSIYMDFFNVHVNFWPLSGQLTYKKYHPGKYLLAFMPKASELNEHSSMAVKNEYGEVFFKQVAGTFARRIVSYNNVGDTVEKGKQCGLIKFGSRIDMFFPLDADIKVEIGDDVVAALSVIAEL